MAEAGEAGEVGEWVLFPVLFTGMVSARATGLPFISANKDFEERPKTIPAAMVFDRDKDVSDGGEGDEDC